MVKTILFVALIIILSFILGYKVKDIIIENKEVVGTVFVTAEQGELTDIYLALKNSEDVLANGSIVKFRINADYKSHKIQ